MPLGQNLISLRARLGTVKDRFELATSSRCLLLPPGEDPVVVEPNPNITTIDSRRVEKFLSPDVQIEGDEQVVKGLTRLYSRELIEKSDLLIAAEETAGGYRGKLARVLSIEDKAPTVWGLIVRVVEDDHLVRLLAPNFELTYSLDTNALALLI